MGWNTCTLFFQMLLLAAFVRPHLRAAAGSPAAAGRTWTRLLDLDGWHVVSPAEAQAWTDDYSSVVTALRSPR